MRSKNLWCQLLPFALSAIGACVESPTTPVESIDHSRDAAPATDADAALSVDAELGFDARIPDARPPSQPDAAQPTDAERAPEASTPDAAGLPVCSDDSDCAARADASRCVPQLGCVACLADEDCTAAGADHCQLPAHRCVGCLHQAHCTQPNNSRCSDAQQCEPCQTQSDCKQIDPTFVCNGSGACVQCASDADCTDPTNSQCSPQGTCQPCLTSAHCSHLTGAAACYAGTCVQCTRNERDACKETPSGRAVCDALTRKCTEHPPQQASLCDTCVSDEQCRQGQRCVQASAANGQTGWFCQWQRGGQGNAPLACAEAAPFASISELGSIDEPERNLPMCVLQAATCSTYKAFREPCGRYGTLPGVIVSSYGDMLIPQRERGKPETAQAIRPDSTVCGIGGQCVASDAATGSYVCTMPCSANVDCRNRVACGSQAPDVCSVN